jgi:hypothetical protein
MNIRLGLVFLGAWISVVEVRSQPAECDSLRLNVAAFDFARELINRGRFVADKKGAWSNDHPTRSQENDFVRDHGFGEFSKWHLAIDARHGDDSKARYKFPYGDFRNVHRCGLLAVRSRAREYGHHEIEAAAVRLLKMIESASPRRQERVD